MLILELIPEMAGIFNSFISEYSKAISGAEGQLDQNELFKLHNKLTMYYAMQAIKLAINFTKDEKIEEAFDSWLKERGGK